MRLVKNLVISTLSSLSLISSAAAQITFPTQPVACSDYEKTVSEQDSWVVCNVIDTRVTARFSPIADIYISPEVESTRYVSAWMGAIGDHKRVEDVSTVLAPEKLDHYFVSKGSMEFFFKPQRTRGYQFQRFSVSSEPGRSVFEPFAYYSNASAEDAIDALLPRTKIFGGIKYRKASKHIEVQCRLQPHAYFEDQMVAVHAKCTSGAIDATRARECQGYQLWKKVTNVMQIPQIPQARTQKGTSGGRRFCTMI